MEEKLRSIAARIDQKDRIQRYKAELENMLAVSPPVPEDFLRFVDHMVSDDVALVTSRQLLKIYAENLGNLQDSVHKDVATYTLEQLSTRTMAFEEQITTIRLSLGGVYESEEDWIAAARCLRDIPFDHARMTNDEKCAIWIKIAMLYLEEGEDAQAETFTGRVGGVIHTCKDPVLHLKYKVCFARILDSKRRFADAATKYHELSQIVGEEERLFALQSAVTCAILIPAGPKRSRILATLYKDERCAKLDIYDMLEKMYLQRLLKKEDVATFSKHLKDHQKATLSDGSTVLERAVTEHNLLSASKIYDNVTFDDLGLLLEISPEKAEEVAAKMIVQGRMEGMIDQLARLIHFQAGETLQSWDSHIEIACHTVNSIVETISASAPQYLA